MSATNLALIGVAVVAIFGAIGAFAIAFRRSQGGARKQTDPTSGVSTETRSADRSMEGVSVAPVAVEEELEPEPEPVPEEETEPEYAGVQIVQTQRVIEVSAEEGGVTRRQFFNRALSALFGSFLAYQGVAYLAFFWPRLTGGFGADIDAGLITDLEIKVHTSDGATLPLFIPEAKAYLVPAPPSLSKQFAGKSVEAGGLMALFQRCVHLGCRVPWCGPSQGFECPCHGSKYNAIGEYFGGPAPRNLDRFVVELVDDRFIIKTGTVIQTPRAPTLSLDYPQGPSCISIVAEA
ncbi:MAG: ubiquinol-cytochrome c reductase iron-sulfur subunit [Acidimicrobiia bacterium]